MFEVFRNDLCDPYKYLYHYTTYETALEHILPSGELRFSPLNKTNDPKETKVWSFTYRTSPNFDIKSEYINSYIIREFRRRCKVICFTRDDSRRRSLDSIKILHRGFSRPRMWAQYAGNHSGVCLVFDKDKLSNQIHQQLSYLGELFEGNVYYTNRAVSNKAFTFDHQKIAELGTKKFIEHHFRKSCKLLLFKKLRDWSTEFEYRWVLFSSNGDYEYVLFEDALKGIVLGADMPEEFIPAIINYSNKYSFTVIQLGWSNGYPVLLTI